MVLQRHAMNIKSLCGLIPELFPHEAIKFPDIRSSKRKQLNERIHTTQTTTWSDGCNQQSRGFKLLTSIALITFLAWLGWSFLAVSGSTCCKSLWSLVWLTLSGFNLKKFVSKCCNISAEDYYYLVGIIYKNHSLYIHVQLWYAGAYEQTTLY